MINSHFIYEARSENKGVLNDMNYMLQAAELNQLVGRKCIRERQFIIFKNKVNTQPD